jgi:hypothetical protein
MSADRIDFISAYCDRWCERCAFTNRCSAFASQIAIAMCDGDVHAGIELAVGQPHPAEPDGKPPGAPPWLAGFESHEPTAEQAAEFEERERARDARIDACAITPAADTYARMAYRWLSATRDQFDGEGDAIVRDALEIIAWDSSLIGAKLHRALHGRDEYQHGDRFGDNHPIQNDWNGSAKVALTSIERSAAAWRTIASCSSGEVPALMADHLEQLRTEVEREFPDARSFVRPGFDEEQPV